MADLTKKMPSDNLAQIFTTHDLSNFRPAHAITHPTAAGKIVTSSAITTKTTPITFGSNYINPKSNTNNNMVLSTIPLDGHSLIIQQQQQQQQTHHQQHQLTTATFASSNLTTTPNKQQQRTAIVAAANNFRATNLQIGNNSNISSISTSNINNFGKHNIIGNNLSSIITAAAATNSKTTIINTNNIKGIIGSNSNNNITNGNANSISSNNINNSLKNINRNGIMSTTSKYVLLQQNSNGQFTTFEGTPIGNSNTNNNLNNNSSNGNNGAANVGNIVLLATEPMELNGNNISDQQHVITTTTNNGDNDEELRPLAWLSDTNLIKGIVTTSSTTTGVVSNSSSNNTQLVSSVKRHIGNNICILNTGNAHDLIEELPQHVAFEENVATTSSPNELPPETQITTLSVSDFQQQFIAASSKRFNTHVGSMGTPLTHFAITQPQHTDAPSSTSSVVGREQHVYNHLPAIGATTTVHVGPSGTTTVVEYKTNTSFIPKSRQLLSGNTIIGSGINNVATTITPTNLSTNNNNSTNVPSLTTSGITVTPTSSISGANNNINPHGSSTSVPTSTITVSVTTNGSIAAAATPKQTSITHNNGSNGNNVASSNNTTNTIIYQGQKQSNSNNNISNTNTTTITVGAKSNSNSPSTTTTHHPHKKYLREKMNVLVDHGGGTVSNSSPGITIANNCASITVVASPASSSSSTTSSTAAVNGGNSPPLSKSSFYTLNSNGGTSSNCSSGGATINSNSSAGSAEILAASAPTASPPLTVMGLPAYTIVGQHQNSVRSNSPVMSSPEPTHVKEFTSLSTSQPQRHSMRSPPTSYSSYDNDSLKDFEISTGGGMRHVSSGQQQSPANKNSSLSANSAAGAAQKQKHPNNVPYDPLVHTHNKPPYSFSSLIFMAIEGSNEKALPVKEIYAWIVLHFPYFKTAPTGWKNSVRHNLSLNKSFVKVEKAPNMGKGSLWRVEQQQRPNLIQALTRSPFYPNSAVDKISLKSPNSAGTSAGGSGSSISVANSMLSSPSYDTIDGTCTSSKPTSTLASQIDSCFDPRVFPNLSKAFKDRSEQNLLNDVVADVPEDDIPSDYSTTKEQNNRRSNNSNKYTSYTSTAEHNGVSSVPVVGNSSGNMGNSSGSIMGTFSGYDSIERLARDCGAENIDDVNAATAMLALKHGPKVFSETFQNGAPVITSSPSEDHTYSAGGGSTAGSGASTPHAINGNSNTPVMNGSSNNGTSNGQPNGCDNQSNCASSDAAYESSEENHNITPEELEDQQRHRDGVAALLSLSLSSVMDASGTSTSSCSPIKRASSISIEEEQHISTFNIGSNISNISNSNHNIIGKRMKLLNNVATTSTPIATANSSSSSFSPPSSYMAHHQPGILDEGYNTQSYYGSSTSQASHHSQQPNNHSTSRLVSPTPPKKMKPLRSLRTKIKRKAPWIR